MVLRTFGIGDFAFLFTALQWTLLLTVMALVGGGIVGFFIALARTSQSKPLRPRHPGFDDPIPILLRP
jgi:polar amino acid transport system permease protein